MRFLRMLTGKFALTVLLLLLQIAWLVIAFEHLLGYSVWISTGLNALSVIIVLYIIKRDGNPTYKIGWLLLISQLPLFGGLLYLQIGEKRPTRRLRARLEGEYGRSGKFLAQPREPMRALEQKNVRVASLCKYLSGAGRYPVWENTETQFFPLGEDMYAQMIEQLEAAQHFIFLEYFVVEPGRMWDGIVDILAQKAAQGVDVRLIYDDVGSLGLAPEKLPAQLEALGIKVLAFNPFMPFLSLAMNNRDHRKIMVIDGHTGFTGGINLADEYINAVERFGHWKDTGIMLRGDGVWNLTVMFMEMWNAFKKPEDHYEDFMPPSHHPQPFETNGFVQPFADSPLDGETVSQNAYIDILAQAKRYVYIYTPYLAIDSEMQGALCMAAKRGVDVRIVTPGIPDKRIAYRLTRSYYETLLKSGIRIYEYAPGFLHAKSIVSDDDKAIIGTINMDFRSLYLHFECGVLLYKTQTVAQIKRDVLGTLALSREMTPEGCKRTFIGSLIDAVLRVFSPLM